MSILVEKIKFNYEDFRLEANLDIADGEFHSILGPSGSGKTTLLRIIAGFIQPTSGKIFIDNKDITFLAVSKRNIGMVFQDYSLFPNMNVFNNIAYGLKTKKIEKNKICKRVNELLEIVNLPSYGNRKVFELSGGEKQRIALARAIAPKPKLLLFDEPLSALDAKLRVELRREIKKIQKEAGFSAVYVTHDQQEAMSVSDMLTVINNGKIMQTDSPENIYTKPTNIFTANFVGTLNHYENSYFRPENCEITKNNNFANLELKITICEYIGEKYYCQGLTDKKEKIMFYSKKHIKIGDKVKINITKKLDIDDDSNNLFSADPN